MPAASKLLPLIGLALAACNSATAVSPALDVSLSLSTTSVVQPTVVDIDVTVVNRDSHTVRTADPRSYACVAPYHVVDASGRPVELPGRVCLLIAYAPVALEPGASIVIRDRWALDAADGDRGSRPVDVGQYRVRARVFDGEQERVSAPVTITVRR